MPSFEELRGRIGALPVALEGERRSVDWVSERLGFGRDLRGSIEVFIAGEPLTGSSGATRRMLTHSTWDSARGEVFEANRLILPSEQHFDDFAAFIGAELLDRQIDSNPAAAFSETEPLIELALRLMRDGLEAWIGLVGELLVMEALLLAVGTGDIRRIVEGWAGHSPSKRDFAVGMVGVEVKTAVGHESRHHAQSVQQVNVSELPATEDALVLWSLGLDSQVAQGRTVPDVVDSILDELRRCDKSTADELMADFLALTSRYCGNKLEPYRHDTGRASILYSRPFVVNFSRAYDLDDDGIRMLTRAHLADATHIDERSVEFDFVLPKRVRGDLNPVAGLQAGARAVIERAGFSLRDC